MNENAAGAAEVHDASRRAGGGRKARPEAGTGFRGVCSRLGGKFAARISDSNGQSQAWLGTFDTAEHAARAFDAAAVKMHGAAATTNFRQPAAIDDGGGESSLLHVQGEPSGGQDSGTHFFGVSRLGGGKFGAKIRDSKKSHKWLGTFDTAEDAARAFDAAAVKIRGPATRTNFKLPAAIDDGGVSSLMHFPAEPAGDDVQPKFRGVSRQPGGKFTSKIRDSKGSQKWLGTFDNAEDAARAFDAAAVKIRGPAAITNFKHPAAIDDGGVSWLLHVPAEPSCSQDAGTHFCGVSKLRSGKFGARIREGKTQKWIGTFDTAEDAAKAFDAAAVKIRGPAARTNFKQPVAIADGGVSSLVHCKSIAQVCDRKGKAALSLGGFDSPGMRHDDLFVDLPPAEWQHVDDLLKHMDSTDDREALIEGAAILQHISLADMGIMGQNWVLLQ